MRDTYIEYNLNKLQASFTKKNFIAFSVFFVCFIPGFLIIQINWKNIYPYFLAILIVILLFSPILYQTVRDLKMIKILAYIEQKIPTGHSLHFIFPKYESFLPQIVANLALKPWLLESLTNEGQRLIEKAQWLSYSGFSLTCIKTYYLPSAQELALELVDHNFLQDIMIERLILEGSYKEREILESKLDQSHPILQLLNQKFSLVSKMDDLTLYI